METYSVWTDDDRVDVVVDGAFLPDLIKAMRFKADHIKAHADPGLFTLAAQVMESIDEIIEVRMEAERENLYQPADGKKDAPQDPV